MDRLIDRVLPRFEFSEEHSTAVRAPAAVVERVLRDLRAGDLPVTRLLMGLRTLPGVLLGRGERLPSGTLLDGLLAAGFVMLGERPGEQVVVGAAGRFWQLRGDGIDTLDGPEAFASYARPGSVRAAMDFVVSGSGSRSRLSTSTRIAGTDAAGARVFGRYWRVVMPGSALIRRELLWAVRRRAESEARAG